MKIQIGSGLPLLTIVFALLKAFDKIDWPWLWVLSPTWIPLSVAALFGMFCLAMAVVGAVLK